MATKTLQELLAEQATIDSYYSAAAGKWAAGEFDPTDVVTLLERAEQAESNAENSANVASTAAGLATTAKTDAETASGVAADAKDAAESAKEAAVTASEEAVEKVANAAQVGANNMFEATNTFNGALVANDSLFYKQQELGDLLTYPIAARLMEAGINPVSALAESWDDWVSLNPNWTTLEHLLFYAPLIPDGEYISEINYATSIKSCTYISSATTGNNGNNKLLGNKFNIFTMGTQGRDANRCYAGTSCYYYAPRVTKLIDSLNAFATSSSVPAELSVFTPELTIIRSLTTADSFRQLGTLKTFSIHAPKLVTSFHFADATSNGGKAQYCSVLQSLIAGIGKPETMQTITTLKPLDPENITALQMAAADKNWQFVDSNGTPYTYDENDSDNL